MSTAETIVTGASEPRGAGRRRQRRRVALAVAAGLAASASFGSFLITLPYYALAPGSARPVQDLIKVPDAERDPARGEVLFTTVSLRRAHPIDALVGWLDPDTEVVPEEAILGSTPSSQLRQVNRALMDDAEQVAVVVALRRLGYDVPERGDGALIVGVEPGLPADGRLRPGEAIVAVDARPVATQADAVAAVRAHRPGEVVRLEVDPGDGAAPRTEAIALASRGDVGVVGVSLATRSRRFDLPVDVRIDAGSVGGPSAGLAFALGVLDDLTPGELTGGATVAVTGTIDDQGRVGPIGGVGQKAAAVRRTDAEVFLVPRGQEVEARAHAGAALRVVPVSSLQEALDALANLDGDVAALGAPPPPAR